MDELIARLRAKRFSGRHAMGGGTAGADGGSTSWGGERIMELVNPDGPAAADELERLQAAVARMDAAAGYVFRERGAIIAWLRSHEGLGDRGRWLLVAADEIERGAYRVSPSPTPNQETPHDHE